MEGIFEHLANKAAFFDKIVINVWGARRKRLPASLLITGNFPIGGPGRFYARAAHGEHCLSGNRFEHKYGRLRNYGNVSPFVVTVWAKGSPVTCADALLVLDALFRKGYRAVPSRVELTFDLDAFALWRLQNDMCARATIAAMGTSDAPCPTYYIGGVRSPWQVRIYRKEGFTSRVEFVFRSQFLRRNSIRCLQELYRLRGARLWRLISFRVVDHSLTSPPLPPRVKKLWRHREPLLLGMPASLFCRSLRDLRIDPRPWLVRSKDERSMRRMLKRMVW